MPEYRTLLVPVDGSALGERALPLALTIARRHGAHIYLARVLVHGSDASDATDERATRARACAEAGLEALAATLRTEQGPRIATALLGMHADGALGASNAQRIAMTLLAFAQAIKADLVVMTTHGFGGLVRLWLGSVATALTHESTLPVLLVRPLASNRLASDVFEHILVPLDGGPFSEQVIEHALVLGDPARTSYTLLHIISPLLAEHIVPPYSVGLPAAELATLEAQAQTYLAKIAERLRPHAAVVHTRLVVAEPADAILAQAREQPASLITMATHGRAVLARTMLGSVADRVVRYADVPVLLCRPEWSAHSQVTEQPDAPHQRW